MNPQPDPGQNRPATVVCLLPGGSADENVHGISHLFEHLLLKTLLERQQNGYVAGHTTEDYILLSSAGLQPSDYDETIRRMDFTGDVLERNKNGLLKEIHRESSKMQEEFFRRVWAGTPYERSPLGTPEEVRAITPEIMEAFKRRMIKKTHYFYTRDGGMEIHGPEQDLKQDLEQHEIHPEEQNEEQYIALSSDVPGVYKKTMTFRDRQYDIYSMDNHTLGAGCSIEALYMLERLLCLQNPGKQIQLSEKKNKSALIIEKGTQFLTADTISGLWETARLQISRDIESIRSEFMERALNQLESRYFYGREWEKRIRRLYRLAPHQLMEMQEIFIPGVPPESPASTAN